MKRLAFVLTVLLAMNFVAAAGYVGWLVNTGHLDRTRVAAIREILFPKPPDVEPATQPSPTTQPVLKLEELLAEHAGRPAVEQLQYIRDAFAAQMVQLDRAQREVLALKLQAESAQKAAVAERQQIAKLQQDFSKQQSEAGRKGTEKGFADSLALYNELPARQVKTIFMGLDVETAVQYLQAMEPRTAARISKEFKTPVETARLKTYMERMRAPTTQTTASANP